MADTGNKQYNIKESINRIFRALTGKPNPTDAPDTLFGAVYSENEVFSMLSELLECALPGYGLAIPFGNHPALPTGTPITLGGWLFARNGSLMWYGASGTVSTLAGS